MKKTTLFIFMCMVCVTSVLFHENTCDAATKAYEKAKRAYAAHMKNVDASKVNAFTTLDINKDGIPELLEGYMYEGSNTDQQLTAVYTYSNGKVKKLRNKQFRAEGSLLYSSKKRTLCVYAGGTTGVHGMYKLSKGRLKSVGAIGYYWTDDTCTEKRPQKKGKWITDNAYSKFFKKFKSFDLVTNTVENRNFYLKGQRTIHCSVGDSFSVKPKVAASRSVQYSSSNKSVAKVNAKGKISVRKKGNAVVKIKVNYHGRTEVSIVIIQAKAKFNGGNKNPLVEMKVSSVQQFGNRILLYGDGRIPVNPISSAKSWTQLENGTITVLGKQYVVKSVYDEDLCMQFYYLYEEPNASNYTYVIRGGTYLMNYPNPALYDANENMIYTDVGKISVWVDEEDFSFTYSDSMYHYFYETNKWKDTWIGIDVKKNVASRVMP